MRHLVNTMLLKVYSDKCWFHLMFNIKKHENRKLIPSDLFEMIKDDIKTLHYSLSLEYEGFATTSNPIESFNDKIKSLFTQHDLHSKKIKQSLSKCIKLGLKKNVAAPVPEQDIENDPYPPKRARGRPPKVSSSLNT